MPNLYPMPNLYQIGKGPYEDTSAADISQAIADLQRLEQLHSNAERMKNVGNKHMASQNYQEAFQAYSEAIRLSPTGPQSHVFYSNRAAASLSLKYYSSAADDAKRAIALQPTFGKAHARMGQALYFMKDFEGAITAYEKALSNDETADSAVTWSYLAKAKSKLEKQQQVKQQQQQRQEQMQQQQKNQPQNLPKEQPQNEQSPTSVIAAVSKLESPNKASIEHFYRKGSIHLTRKEYNLALNDFDTVLKLMLQDDDDEVDESSGTLYRLYYNRALTLFHLKDYKAAAADAQLAVDLQQDSYEAYSILGRSLYFLQDYEGAITAFTESFAMNPGEQHAHNLAYDKAYLATAKQELSKLVPPPPPPPSLRQTPPTNRTITPRSSPSTTCSPAPIPKLKPPRFVPREEAMASTPNLPSMPKSWPCQNFIGDTTIFVGPEREVLIHEGVMGLQLNRGTDGFIRIISAHILPDDDPQLAQREGSVLTHGDVVREAAGVDLRRPITNMMWGDTVTLMKVVKRPIRFVVAKEFSEPPASVQEKLSQAQLEEMERIMLRRPEISGSPVR